MQQFGKKAPYKSLEQRLQRDIKTFFGDYRTAQLSGFQLLKEAADSEKIKSACNDAVESGLGYLEDGRALQLHIELTERLPIILRAYISCGLVLYDSISDFQLVKIHAESGKLTFLKYEEFETSPLPLLSKRIKRRLRRSSQKRSSIWLPEAAKEIASATSFSTSGELRCEDLVRCTAIIFFPPF
jgi:DNA phosphorothioation-associated putative methyltransferase